MSASLARFLKDFSAPPPPVMPALTEAFDLPLENEITFALPPVPEIDIEEERRAAFEEGREAMRAELEEVHAAEIAALHASRAEAEAAMAQQFEAEAAARIASGLAEIANGLTDRLSAGVFNALLPLLDKEMAERAIEALADTVRSSFQEPDGIELVLRGPKSLADRLAEHLDGAGFKFRHVEGQGPDLGVECDEMVMVTRLAAWRDSVEELAK